MNITLIERSIIVIAAVATIISAIVTCQQLISASEDISPQSNPITQQCREPG